MQMDLKHLLKIAQRWWWLVILALIVGGSSAYAVSQRQQRLYTAETTIFISGVVNDTTNYGSIQASQSLTETYKAWAISRPILEKASSDLNYPGDVEHLREQVSVKRIPDTLFIQISATDPDPVRASEIANTIATVFVDDVTTQSQAQNIEIKASIDKQISATSAQINDLNTSIDLLQTKEQPLATEEQRNLNALMTRRSQLQQDLDQLQSTATTLALNAAATGSQVSISAPAQAPESPTSPNVLRQTILGIASGGAIGIAVILLIEYFDNRLRTTEELSQISSAPILATVGRAPVPSKDQNPLFVLRNPDAGPAEAMRLLRANLEFVSAPTLYTSLVVTSPAPSEGKSTLVSNLGVVMAQAGLKTLIIDADLRNPVQHQTFGIRNEKGLSTFLTRPSQDWSDVTVKLDVAGLSLLPSGPVPPNPADILLLPQFDNLLHSTQDIFDVVLIDTPPVLAASDALSVAARSSATVIVCRLGATRRNDFSEATKALKQASARILGVIVNHPRNGVENYYGYQYKPNGLPSSAPYYYGADLTALPRISPHHPAPLLVPRKHSIKEA